MRYLRSGIPALFAGALLASLVAFAAPAARAQISGDFEYDTNYHVFFVHGDTTIDGDLTITGSFGVQNDVVVGKDDAAGFSTLTPVTPITLTITGAPDGSSGANVEFNGKLQVPSADFIGGVAVYGDHVINVEGGYALALTGHESSTVNVTGGVVSNLYAYNTAIVAISGGYVDSALATGNSSIDISGGSLYEVEGRDFASVNLIDGDVSNVSSLNDSFINIGGGTIGDVTAGDNGIVNIDAGSLTSLTASGNALASLNGGTLDSAGVSGSSDIYVNGGSISTISVSDDASAVLFYDTGATVAAQGAFTEYDADAEVVYAGTQYQVTGDLLSGDPLDAIVKAGNYDDDGVALTFFGAAAAPDLYITDPMTVSGAYNSVNVGENEDGSIESSPTVAINDSFVRDVYALNAGDVTVTNSIINREAYAYDDSTLHLVDSTVNNAYALNNGNLILDNSQLNLVQVEGNGTATLNSGFSQEADTFDQSVFTLNGGSVNYIYPSGGTVNVAGGDVFALSADFDSHVNITGGSTHFLVGYDTTEIQIADGVVDSLNVNDDAVAAITGGDIANVYANGNGLLDLSGGTVGDVRLRGHSVMSMSGGTLANISLFDNNVFAITGGNLTGGVFVYELSDALITGAGVGYSIAGQWLPANHAPGFIYSVSGFWNDGSATPFSFLVYSRTDAPTFTGDATLGTLSFRGVAAAPEPATLGLLALGVFFAACQAARRRNPL